MDRKSFIQALAAIPFFGIPLKALANAFRKDSCKTQRDAEGPFYKAAAPARSVIEKEGEALRIEGKVLKADDCQTPVSNAVLDVWHCDSHGEYDMQGYKCRAVVRTDASGRYSFTTIFPPPYGNRPRHIHFKIRAEGHGELTTQLYFKGDPNIRNDFARNAEQSRIIALQPEKDLRKGTFDIYL
jgi:protocatechuate 3,4-dioxygenase beta subunit